MYLSSSSSWPRGDGRLGEVLVLLREEGGDAGAEVGVAADTGGRRTLEDTLEHPRELLASCGRAFLALVKRLDGGADLAGDFGQYEPVNIIGPKLTGHQRAEMPPAAAGEAAKSYHSHLFTPCVVS